jgi:SAM-dependent methyltransferase
MATLAPAVSTDLAIQCPACGHDGMRVFYQVPSVPTNSCLQLDSPEEAREIPRGRIELAHCSGCGFISNVAFDKRLTEYSGRYEETQGFSPTFRGFHEQLAQRLIDRYDLHGRSIVEIGCGKGEFLHLMCAMGDNSGLGYDPAYVEDRQQPVRGKHVTFVQDFFSERYSIDHADLVCCKMTLEHIPTVRRFVATIRDAIRTQGDTTIFFQVPETERILKDRAFEDIYYEHCSYFTPASLNRLFSGLGFELMATETEYGDQYLTIEARLGAGSPSASPSEDEEDLMRLSRMVDRFRLHIGSKLDHWRRLLNEHAERGDPVVLWGSGSKGVSFLTTLGVTDEVAAAVDINPHRQGHYMSGTGHPIVAPDHLRELRPALVIVMNRVYREEVRGILNGLGLSPPIEAL